MTSESEWTRWHLCRVNCNEWRLVKEKLRGPFCVFLRASCCSMPLNHSTRLPLQKLVVLELLNILLVLPFFFGVFSELISELLLATRVEKVGHPTILREYHVALLWGPSMQCVTSTNYNLALTWSCSFNASSMAAMTATSFSSCNLGATT